VHLRGCARLRHAETAHIRERQNSYRRPLIHQVFFVKGCAGFEDRQHNALLSLAKSKNKTRHKRPHCFPAPRSHEARHVHGSMRVCPAVRSRAIWRTADGLCNAFGFVHSLLPPPLKGLDDSSSHFCAFCWYTPGLPVLSSRTVTSRLAT